MNRRRVMMIGLDGFCQSVATPLLAAGAMGTLAELMQQGSCGALQSVVPFSTAPAWSAFMTGCAPAQNSVLSFHGYDRDERRVYLNSCANLAAPSIWDLLSQGGKTAVSLGMPMTSPPPQINGVVIPGLMCPGLSANTVHPSEAYGKYIEAEPAYRIMETGPAPTAEALADRHIAVEAARLRVGLRLLADVDWDVFFYQIQSTDPFQHHGWAVLDKECAGYREEYFEQACRFYRSCDDAIARLIEQAGPETLVLLVSDHGFTRLRYNVNLNAWLKEKGLLALRGLEQSRWQQRKETAKRIAPPLKWLARAYGRMKHRGPAPAELVPPAACLQDAIDLENSRAFVMGSMAGLVYATGTDEQRRQTAGEVRDLLLNELGPGRSPQIVESVVDGAEAFGALSDELQPDLLVNYCRGVFGHIDPRGAEVVSEPNTSDPMGLLGTHDRAGMFVAAGPGVKRGRRFDAEIVDVAPTVLAWLGLDVPRHMDGRVMAQAFDEPPEVRFSEESRQQGGRTEYSAEEQADIEKRLGELGYM